MEQKTRQTTTTTGKKISFNHIGKYYTPDTYCKEDSDELFGNFKKLKYCVAYTTIRHDTGYNSLTLEYFDNGIMGYQNFNFFDSKSEAIKDYEDRKQLTPKVGTIGYADVFLFNKL